MINHTTLPLPNSIDTSTNYERSYSVSPPEFKDPSAPGGVTSEVIKANAREAKRPKSREELRVHGPTSESASPADAPRGSQRVGGPTTESVAPKPYEPGDMPPNAGDNFTDGSPEDGEQRNLARLADSNAAQPSDAPKKPFQILQADWIELSPYGDFPHALGIQRVDRDAAERIVAHFNSFFGKLGRRFAGVPVFIGHPDVPSMASEYRDKKAYGWITELQARPAGLFARIKWSNQGYDLLQNAHYKFYSPYWEAVFIGEHGTRKIYRPTNLISVGLTNQPNLPVPPLANEKSKSPSSPSPRGPHVANATDHNGQQDSGGLGKSLGRGEGPRGLGNPLGRGEGPASSNLNSESSNATSLEPSLSSFTSVENSNPHSAFQNSQFPALPLANEVLALQQLLRQRDERIHALHAQIENARTNWTSSRAALENQIADLTATVEALTNSRVDIVLDQALEHGRIAPAERDFWNTQLRRDFDIRLTELKNRPEVMHMQSITGNLGKQKVDLANTETRQRILQELLQAKQRGGLSYNDAWFALKQERPDLFAAMQGNH